MPSAGTAWKNCTSGDPRSVYIFPSSVKKYNVFFLVCKRQQVDRALSLSDTCCQVRNCNQNYTQTDPSSLLFSYLCLHIAKSVKRPDDILDDVVVKACRRGPLLGTYTLLMVLQEGQEHLLHLRSCRCHLRDQNFLPSGYLQCKETRFRALQEMLGFWV